MDLAHVNLWAPDAKLVVHEGGSTREVPPPKLPAYKGHLTNVTRHGPGASVTATVRPGGTLHIHIYEDGQDVVLESASGFNSVPQNKASIPVNGYILYNTSSVLDSALAKDEVLHHSSTPLPGLHVPHRTTHDDHGHHHIGRRLSHGITHYLPTGPPYGRLHTCPAQPTFYSNKIGIVADWGFSLATGGTQASVLAEISSIITQTNAIFSDQVGVDFSLGTVVINLDGTGSPASTGPNFKPTPAGTRNTCTDATGATIVDAYTSVPALDSSNPSATLNVDVKGAPDKLLGRLANWVGNGAPACEGCSHWHLLTDCLPVVAGAGGVTVGLAFTGVGCDSLSSRRGQVTDSGSACSATSEGCDVR